MLEELRVRNLGLIEDARLEPGPGLVVVTGETGTGKTLLLGALRLLCGALAREEQVGPTGDEALVEGRFLLPGGEEVVAARRLVAGGRNRAYLDGAMVPARAVEERLGGLVEVVGQHDHVRLNRGSEVRTLVDGLLDESGRGARGAYREAWERMVGLGNERERMGGDPGALERELDLVAFQAEEIDRAGFSPGEDEDLRKQADRLRHADELAERLGRARQGVEEADETIGGAVEELRRALRRDPGLAALLERAEQLRALSAELGSDLRRMGETLERDPGRLAAVEERLALLGRLSRKYGETLDEILGFGEEAARRRGEITGLLERSSSLEAELAGARETLLEAADRLRAARRRAARRLSEETAVHLRELGFTDPVVEVEMVGGEPGQDGADELRLLFASDAALRTSPVGQVASGGELSRLVLSLRLAGGAGEAPVVAFDEVDAGLGGKAALMLGRKLAALARERQVLCVTHLPQVAAFAGTHFVVGREENRATVRRMEGGDRVAELSRMLAGLPESDRGRQHAEELLALAADRPVPPGDAR